MEIIEKTLDFQLHNDTAVALGKFDGVHIGHRRLLAEVLAQKEAGLKACVFTFDPPPAVLFGFSDGKELSTKEEKRRMFHEMGVDVLIEFPLTRETADISGEDFLREFLCRRMRARFIAAGEDLSFGKKGAGNAQLLRALAAELSYEVKLIEKVCVDGEEVSSTRVRKLVEQGAMESVGRLLGAPYSVCGTVVTGNRIGRTLGFPTMNLLWPENKLCPPNGVYQSKVKLRDKVYDAISNVGCKPTVTNEKVMGLESYVYDFHGEVYGEQIQVELFSFRRPEQRFAGLEELKAQLQKDIEAGRQKTREM